MATKNPAPVASKNPEIIAGTEDWVEQQLGFAPYYNPKIGDTFVATPVEIDDKDPEFNRFVFVAGMIMECARGPKDDAEPVTVNDGEQFTMGAYAMLAPLFEDYLGMKCRVTVVDQIKIADGKRTLYRFKLAVSPSDNKLIAERKAARTKAKLAARRDEKQHAANNAAQA